MKSTSNSALRTWLKSVPLARPAARMIRRGPQVLAFLKDFQAFKRLSSQTAARFSLRWQDRCPQLDDKTSDTPFDHHYVLHTAWAARMLMRLKPAHHVDISSNLFFVGACSALVPMDFYDYRPAKLTLSNLDCKRGDLMQLPFADASVPSLSCMHVVEHIGLGRYGDPLDPEGDLKAMRELARVVRVGGSLLFVTPVGQPRIQFNAHRIYSYEQVVGAFPDYALRECALIPDVNDGGWTVNAPPAQFNAQKYGCGCFWFERLR